MIEDPIPVEAPGGFAPAFALGSTDAAGMLALIGDKTPLATVSRPPQAPPALEGEATGAQVAGPFTPAPFAPVFLTLSGEWEGAVRVLRSSDGGANQFPLTLGGSDWARFTANACEPVWAESEEGAALYLELAPTSGSIAYRLAQ